MHAPVALETTVFTHGLPAPTHLETARQMCGTVRLHGGTPRLIGIYAGRPVTDLSDDQLAGMTATSEVRKCSLRDLPILGNTREMAGTTVSATLFLAHRAGIPVFATGGIGGVHPGTSGDVSADLPALARIPGLVVCSGAKSILDLPRTRERLETDGVTVLGWQCDRFPAFTSGLTALPVDQRVDTAEAVADMMRIRDELGLPQSLLLCVPCPEAEAVSEAETAAWTAAAQAEAAAKNLDGKDLTPFLLRRMAELSQGRSLRANVALLLNNAAVAAQVSKAFSRISA